MTITQPAHTEWIIDRLYTVPAGNPSSSPIILDDSLGDVWANSASVRIPPGHCGQTGIQIVYAGVPIIPWNDPTQFIVDDDQRYDFDLAMEIDQSLTIVLFNNGLYDHTFYVKWNVTPIVLKASAIAAGIVPIVQGFGGGPVL